MKVDVLLGVQWGDEGKGKIVDVLSPGYDIIARFQGGPNAGHTIEFEGMKFVLHTIPSGIFNPEKTNLIGNGVIIDPVIFQNEIIHLRQKGIDPKRNLLISRKAHLIVPGHRLLDAVYETAKGKEMIGSTLKGIGPTYTDKIARLGIRVGDITGNHFRQSYDKLKAAHLKIVNAYNASVKDFKLDGSDFDTYEEKWFEAIEELKNYHLTDSEYYINKNLDAGKHVLAEGAQGSLLDIDFGSYPFVTSSNTITAGVCSGLGIPPSRVGKVFGVFKAYCTRVGNGPFPSELFDDSGITMRDEGHEYGSTTGRPRRCGWLDLTALSYAIMLNGVTHLVMTKGDVLSRFETLKVSRAYLHDNREIDYIPFDCNHLSPIFTEMNGWNSTISHFKTFGELPQAFRDYVSFIEKKTGIPVSIISVGPDRTQTIIRD
ncbi:MAG TPA: adenylosuccinate synthase [Bacteroidales bacterium]|nr:adenylosuccinate synthase [Bacteroidales bacterium]